MLVKYYNIIHTSVMEIDMDLYDYYEYDYIYKKAIDICNANINYYESNNAHWASIIIKAHINAYGIIRDHTALDALKTVNLINSHQSETSFSGVRPNDWVSSVMWCLDNFEPSGFLVIENQSVGGDTMNVYFRDKADAMAFKLRWG